jgi:uncharacterized OB-fold protein
MTEQKQEQEKELLAISSGDAAQPFRWSVGKHGSRFLAELRDNKKLFGVKCPKCGRVYAPPRLVCGRCWVAMDEFVPLKDEGEIVVCTIIQFSFVDPNTGIQRPVPYGYAFIKLDGADTAIPHFLDSTDPKKVKVGARVKAVFEDKRTGSLMDIKHFTVL